MGDFNQFSVFGVEIGIFEGNFGSLPNIVLFWTLVFFPVEVKSKKWNPSKVSALGFSANRPKKAVRDLIWGGGMAWGWASS